VFIKKYPSYYLDTNVVDFDLYIQHLVSAFIQDDSFEIRLVVEQANDNAGVEEILELTFDLEETDNDE